MTKKLVFEVQDAEVIDESSNQFALARIHAFSSGINRHNLTCDVETLKRTAHTLYEKPVVFDYDPAWGDFVGHVDKPFIAGFIVPDTAEFEELPDGRIGLMVTAKIWKYYSRNFVEIFAKDSQHVRKVSVEMELTELEENKETGIDKMLNFIYTAVAVLGTFVTEASPGAHMQMLSFSKVDDKEAYFKEFAKYEEIDFTIPDSVRKNCVEGLRLREEFGRGGTSVGLATAKYLSKNSTITPQRARNMAHFFKKNKGKNLDDKQSDEWIAWMLWGSHPGKKWSAQIVSQMNEADDKLAVYFEGDDIMPYSSMKDVNPAIKGIKPPVTLAQANAIARQADAVGSNEDKNGWAIAISNFKKTHKVENGKWVKKETSGGKKNHSVSELESNGLDSGKEESALENEKLDNTEEFATEEAPKEEKEDMSEEEKKDEEKEDMSEMPSEMMEEEESDDNEKEEEEEDETHMSASSYEEVGEVVAMLEGMEGFTASEDGTYSDAVLVPLMHKRMTQMSAELAELKEYRDKIEDDKLEFEVNQVIAEVQEVVPEAEITAFMEKVSEFGSENLEGWKNFVRARAFEFAKNSKDDDDAPEIKGKYAIPFKGTGTRKTKGQPFA